MRFQSRSVRASAVLSALLLTVAVTAQAQDTRSKTLSSISIENFGRVNDHYFRGAQPKDRDYADLATLGVKTVIDLTADGEAGEAAQVERAGMHFYRIPLTTHTGPAGADVATFLRLVNDPANQPVYVHCQGGHHRTGVMTAVYRMTNDGWAPDRAFQEMETYGFGPAFLHSALKDFVYDYYRHLTPAAAPPVLEATNSASAGAAQ